MHPLHQAIAEAVDCGTPLTVKDLRELRAQSRKAITGYKTFFWVGIALMNLILWVPMPLDRALLVGVAIVVMAAATIVPIFGLRKHQKIIAMLEASAAAPKQKNASEAGKAYIEQVRKEGRSFVVAEYDVLEGSRTGKVAL